MAKLARRSLEAVRELERLQQEERLAAGEPELEAEQFRGHCQLNQLSSRLNRKRGSTM
jgi:hypothetical protein